jgi:hypothetical protein
MPKTEEKPIMAFRFSQSLVDWLRDRSDKRDWSMTELVTRILDCPRTSCGLPPLMSEVLEADRKALGMDEYGYLTHLYARRYNEIRDGAGPGFEKKDKRK